MLHGLAPPIPSTHAKKPSSLGGRGPQANVVPPPFAPVRGLVPPAVVAGGRALTGAKRSRLPRLGRFTRKLREVAQKKGGDDTRSERIVLWAPQRFPAWSPQRDACWIAAGLSLPHRAGLRFHAAPLPRGCVSPRWGSAMGRAMGCCQPSGAQSHAAAPSNAPNAAAAAMRRIRRQSARRRARRT